MGIKRRKPEEIVMKLRQITPHEPRSLRRPKPRMRLRWAPLLFSVAGSAPSKQLHFWQRFQLAKVLEKPLIQQDRRQFIDSSPGL